MAFIDGGAVIYDQLNSWADLASLIANGDAESLHLEAKAPTDPKVTRDQKDYLGKAASGFANTAGGVIVWGVSTTKHAHSGLDVLTQLEPIGQCALFMQQVQKLLPVLTVPPVTAARSKILREKASDTRGVVVTHIPLSTSAPVHSASDNVFYWRSGDDFHPAPYEVVQRLFRTGSAPDLHPRCEAALVKRESDGSWTIPIAAENRSNAAADGISASVRIDNHNDCEHVAVERFTDASGFNPGKRLFMLEVKGRVYRRLNQLLGTIQVRMKVGKRAKRRLRFTITLYADGADPRETTFVVDLAKSGFKVRQAHSKLLV